MTVIPKEDTPPEDRVIAKLSNEYATIWLELDRTGNSPRIVVHSLRDHEQVELDPMSLALLCHLDTEMLGLLADIAKDGGARREFHAWREALRAEQARVQAGAGATPARSSGPAAP